MDKECEKAGGEEKVEEESAAFNHRTAIHIILYHPSS